MEDIILYSNGCPRCKILEQKLKEKKITFNKIDDINEMTSLGLDSVPWIKINGNMMNFADSLNWLNNL